VLWQHVFQVAVCVLSAARRATTRTPHGTDYFYKSVALARLIVSYLRMVQMDRNM